MATAKAFGQITIIDVTDIGEFSVYPMSNNPLSVIYDPDQNSYTPNWGTNHLVLTPAIYYAGTKLSNTDTNLTVTWQRQEGVAAASNLASNETVSNGTLTVSANKFGSSVSMITYIVTASYVEPSSKQTLQAQGQITFSLVKHASTVQNCTITGDNIFKITSEGITSPAKITLSGTVTGGNNIGISKWQYQTSTGTWADYPVTSGHNANNTSATLDVYPNENVFNNDRAVIRLMTTVSTVYDIMNVVILRDGAAGSTLVTGSLSNENQMLPFDSQGNCQTNFASGNVNTTMTIYEGGTDVTADWTITATPSSGVSGNLSGATYTVSGITKGSTVTYVDLHAVHKTEPDKYGAVDKRFSITGVTSGADGSSPEIYELELSAVAVKRSEAKAYTPNSITCKAYKIVGNSKTAYSGRFICKQSGTQVYSSTANESTHTFAISSYTTATSFEVELYAAGGTTNKLDSQTIVIADDGAAGKPGDKGDTGEAAINLVLGNYSDVIPVSTEYKTTSQIIINIPFSAYKGTGMIACTATAPALFGVTASVTNATASAQGQITYTIPSGTSVGSASQTSGNVSLSFVCSGQTIAETYSWTISKAAVDGSDAVFMELYTPNGYIFSNGQGSLQVKAVLYKGSTDVTNQVTKWGWAKYTTSGYVNITSSNASGVTGYTSATLTVPGTAVDSYASYRCTATYGGKTYIQYSSLMDKTDPLQVSVFSTVGTQIVNGNGVGAIYCRVMRNNTEVDTLKTENFVLEKPASGMTTGAFYYYIDKANKTVSLKKATSGTAWTDASSTEKAYTGTYVWGFRDADNQHMTTGVPNTSMNNGKVFYIDADLINSKIIMDVEVTV